VVTRRLMERMRALESEVASKRYNEKRTSRRDGVWQRGMKLSLISLKKRWPAFLTGILHSFSHPYFGFNHFRLSLHQILNMNNRFSCIPGLIGWEHKVPT